MNCEYFCLTLRWLFLRSPEGNLTGGFVAAVSLGFLQRINGFVIKEIFRQHIFISDSSTMQIQFHTISLFLIFKTRIIAEATALKLFGLTENWLVARTRLSHASLNQVCNQ